jgi:hypothetical protein
LIQLLAMAKMRPDGVWDGDWLLREVVCFITSFLYNVSEYSKI